MQQGIPRQAGRSVPDFAGYETPGGSLSYVGLNQKLDRVLELFEEQRRESMAIKSELAIHYEQILTVAGRQVALHHPAVLLPQWLLSYPLICR